MFTFSLQRNKTFFKNVYFAICNVLIVVAILFLCIGYVRSLQREGEHTAQESFVAAVASMRKAARAYLTAQQQPCNDWAAYINSHQMTVEETLSYLFYANSMENVMGHIIDYDTLQGFSAQPDAQGRNAVDYSIHRKDFARLMELIRNHREGTDSPQMTQAYSNPIDNNLSVGFCHNIRLVDETGKDKDYLLIRTVPSSALNEKWSFPKQYPDAELSLITTEGDYIIHSPSLKTTNFWVYAQSFTDIGYDNVSSLRDAFYSNEITLRTVMNEDKEVYYVVCLPALDESQWYYIGYTPVASVARQQPDFTMVAYITLGFLLLLLFNVFHIVRVNKQLSASLEETKRANLAKTRFLSSISHDIRTPMNAIIGMTAIASRHVEDPVYVQDCLKKVTLASNHLLALINDVLDISKVESGKLNMNYSVFSLAELASNLISIVRPQVQEKNLSFDVHIHKIQHEFLFGDELRLNQVFINILSNAVKYTPAGGTIRVSLREEPAGDNSVLLTFRVADNGVGISKQFQEKMYDTFSRATDSRIDKIQGSGLGLAICKQIVDLMGGTIECDSALGRGTIFTVRITLLIGEHQSQEQTLPPMKVLIIDNDEVFLETSADTLHSLGLEVDTASNGAAALEKIKRCHDLGQDYPLIIVDWKMPEMDGLAIVRTIRQQMHSNTPIIVASAYDLAEMENELHTAGADGFISKPFFRSTIYETMSQILGLNAAKDEDNAEDNALDLSHSHVLIAEDNDLNWEIIEEILSVYNITADRAENGKICVDMLTSSKPGTYSAILMDIQMPVMNGRDAARAIRALPVESTSRIPIIAMTADAFAEDVQACLDAGMNSHVAKPIDINLLFKALRKAGVGKKNR